MLRCPACDGAEARLGPPSRATTRRVAGCPNCGARFLPDADPTPFDIIGTDEVSAEDYERWVDKKRESNPEAWRAVALHLRDRLPETAHPRLHDIGAGDGGFLALARDTFGFDVSGNELLAGAIDLAERRHGVTLQLGHLGNLGHTDLDAITMWCVLAHAPDHGTQLLADAHKALRIGGRLYLQTPRWCSADHAARAAQRLTRGRVSRLTDRRVAPHHRVLHTTRSITTQLTRAGFTEIEARPALRYPLQSESYLRSLRVPAPLVSPGARTMDAAIRSRLAPRIIVEVHARKA